MTNALTRKLMMFDRYVTDNLLLNRSEGALPRGEYGCDAHDQQGPCRGRTKPFGGLGYSVAGAHRGVCPDDSKGETSGQVGHHAMVVPSLQNQPAKGTLQIQRFQLPAGFFETIVCTYVIKAQI